MPKGMGSKADILTRTRDGQDLNAIWNEYQAALAEFNATRQPLIDLLSTPVSGIVDEAGAPALASFERKTEFGVAESIRPLPTTADRAYPFEWFDTRAAFSWEMLIDATKAQMDQVLNMVMEADNRLQYEQTMKALFNNANRSTNVLGYTSAFTVVALYNADSRYIPPYAGQSFDASTHTHYLSSGSNTGQVAFDPQDFLDLAATIEHHGYNPGQGYKVLFLMNPADANASVVRFRRGVDFVSGGASEVESLYDFIPPASSVTQLIPVGYNLVGSQAADSWAGLDVVGTWGEYTVLKDYQIPTGYLVAFAVNTGNTATRIIGLREHDNPALRGVVLKPGPRDAYPVIESHFARGLGAGVRERGAAAIMKLDDTGGAYTVPAAFAW